MQQLNRGFYGFSEFLAPQNLTYSLHEAGGGNDWWNRFQPSMEL